MFILTKKRLFWVVVTLTSALLMILLVIKKEVPQSKKRIVLAELHNDSYLSPSSVTRLTREAYDKLIKNLGEKYQVVRTIVPSDCNDDCPRMKIHELEAHYMILGSVYENAKSGKIDISLKLHTKEQLLASYISETKALDDLINKISTHINPPLEKYDISQLVLPPYVDEKLNDIDFNSASIENLELYKQALSVDNNPNQTPQKKIQLWKDVLARVKGAESIATTRLNLWSTYQQVEHQYQSRIALLNQKIEEEEAKNYETQQRIKSSWDKLSQLLKLDVVSNENEQLWVKSFLTTYGYDKKLNPYVTEPLISKYLQLPSIEKSDADEQKDQKKLDQLKQRDHQRKLDYCKLVIGISDEECLNISIPVGSSPTKGGDGEALVTIVEFSDFQCPFCNRAVSTLNQIMKDYNKDKLQVRVVFKHNPLPFHKDAFYAAKAAFAAHQQGKFWEMHDKLFMSSRSLKAELVDSFAEKIGLDMKRYEDDVNSKAAEAIKADQALAIKLGARNTPYFFVNGVHIPGALPVDRFKEVIDAEITAVQEAINNDEKKPSEVYDERVQRNFTRFKIESLRSEVQADIKWVRIPEGSFEMGSHTGYSDEQPSHRVYMSSFEISKTEVTIGQYRKCIEVGFCSEPLRVSSCDWDKPDKENHPIKCIDWGQARTFAKWVGADVDLPSEAEWEYAAGGGHSDIYVGSNNMNEVSLYGWYIFNSGNTTHNVGEKEANGFGLYDMSSNVLEWTLDEWHDSYLGAPEDGKAWGDVQMCEQVCDSDSTKRIIRGGSYDGDVDTLRVTMRHKAQSDTQYLNVGFRLRRAITHK